MSTTTRALSVCALAIAAGSASADVLETIDFGDLVHGEIVSTQYQGSHGVTIDARNYSRFSFDEVKTGIGFDILDLESPDVEATSLKLYLDGSLVASIDFADFINPGSDLYDASVSFGNNSANRIGLISAADLGIAGFDTAKFKFGGSMAIDTIKTVPAPGTFALLGLGGACVARRRR
jgi:hypothetical protein